MQNKLMRDELYEQYEFLELQDKILEIAQYIDRFCTENEIEYCLMGGSALGAKRHGGFIPWDDDLDIFMTPDNYEKFRKVFIEKGDKNLFYLQEYGATDGMITISKLRMNNTTYVESILKEYDVHQGIYVDIFILHKCPNSKLKQIRQCIWAKYVIVKGLANRDYDHRGKLIVSLLKVLKVLPQKFLVKHGLKEVYKYRDSDTNYYCNFLGKAVFKNAIYKKEWFESTEYIPFEKIKLRVPNGLHEFLTLRFGDYMKVPSPERIKYEQHAEFWDINKDFREYLKHIDCYKDTSKLI